MRIQKAYLFAMSSTTSTSRASYQRTFRTKTRQPDGAAGKPRVCCATLRLKHTHTHIHASK